MPEAATAEDQELNRDLEQMNFVDDLEDEELARIASDIIDAVDDDLESRSEWEDRNDEWMKLAAQVMESKDYPWPGAANVKYPLVSTAALQFHARAYPSLVNDSQLVKGRIFGKRTQAKRDRARRVKDHMGYQLLFGMKNWQEDMDRLLYILPITGLAYKKTYFSPADNMNASPLVLPRDLIVNYHATSFERAIKTHRMYKDENEIRELINAEIYADVDLTEPVEKDHDGVEDEITGLTPVSRSDDMPYEIYECHTYYDLDDDGYKEPVIITVIKDIEKVVRIVNRYSVEDVEQAEDGSIIKITPTEYFTAYKFLPNPESSIYALGFGALLGPLNKAVNTTINQLLDAGTLSNLQAGFLGKGVRMRGGNRPFRPGEWRSTQSSGEDLKKGIMPLPTREPSGVLFNLLGMLVDSGERLSSIKDVMVGENPGQNQPYSTTVAVLEQGMKVFVGIYKRVYRSLGEEYKKLYRLNGLYLPEREYYDLIDADDNSEEEGQGVIMRDDYTAEGLDVIPGADPNIMSDAQKQMKANSLLQKLAAGMPLNPQEVTRRTLEAEDHEDIELLMQTPPPQPDFETQLKMQQQQHTEKYQWAELQLKAKTSEFEAFKDYSQAVANLAKAAATQNGMEAQTVELVMKDLKTRSDILTQEMGAITDLIQAAMPAEESPAEEAAEGEMTEE